MAVTILACSLAACAGSLFQSKEIPQSVYLLSAKPSAPAAVIAADLAVLQPRVRPGLESDRIAVLYPDRRLDYFAGARWSGPLDQVVQDLLVQVMHSAGGLRNVSADSSAFTSGYWLELEIADFQAEYSTNAAAAPTIHVRLRARLGSSAERMVIGSFAADRRQVAADNRLSAIVDAYELAANAALGEIVADAVHTLKEASVGR